MLGPHGHLGRSVLRPAGSPSKRDIELAEIRLQLTEEECASDRIATKFIARRTRLVLSKRPRPGTDSGPSGPTGANVLPLAEVVSG